MNSLKDQIAELEAKLNIADSELNRKNIIIAEQNQKLQTMTQNLQANSISLIEMQNELTLANQALKEQNSQSSTQESQTHNNPITVKFNI